MINKSYKREIPGQAGNDNVNTSSKREIPGQAGNDRANFPCCITIQQKEIFEGTVHYIWS